MKSVVNRAFSEPWRRASSQVIYEPQSKIVKLVWFNIERKVQIEVDVIVWARIRTDLVR